MIDLKGGVNSHSEYRWLSTHVTESVLHDLHFPVRTYLPLLSETSLRWGAEFPPLTHDALAFVSDGESIDNERG